MRTLQKFTGINNVLAAEQIGGSELQMASNVDIDLAGRASRRDGFALASATAHANLWEAKGFTLATRGAGDLVNVDTNTVLAAAIGNSRVWYCDLPDDTVAYSNGTVRGIVSAAGDAVKSWGVPIPATIGVALDVAGNLHPGDYQYALTYKRISDGAESGPAYSAGAVTLASGGINLSSLPVLADHKINVYLTSHYGGERFLAGSTTTALFTFTGKNSDLAVPCPTEFLQPPPAGAKLLAFWHGRALAAVGNVLFASRSHGWGLFDMRRDFKQFSAPITLVQPTSGGIWVGTEKELVFLAGDTWDKLTRIVKIPGGVVLGSGVPVPGEHLRVGSAVADGDCMVCVADGWLVAGMSNGDVLPLSTDRYRVDADEVRATFRLAGKTPQYVAIPQ